MNIFKKTLSKSLIFGLLLYSSSYLFADVIFKKLDGEQISLSKYKGSWVLINYWASWCPACLDEISSLNAFQKHYKNKAVVLAVNFDYLPAKDLALLVKELNISYISLLKDPAKELKLEAIEGLPVTFIFDPSGKLKTTLYGQQGEAQFRAAISS